MMELTPQLVAPWVQTFGFPAVLAGALIYWMMKTLSARLEENTQATRACAEAITALTVQLVAGGLIDRKGA